MSIVGFVCTCSKALCHETKNSRMVPFGSFCTCTTGCVRKHNVWTANQLKIMYPNPDVESYLFVYIYALNLGGRVGGGGGSPMWFKFFRGGVSRF